MPVAITKVVNESLRSTLTRTVLVAIFIATIGLVIARGLHWSADDLWPWFARFCAVMWFSFGGHWVEVFYLRTVLPKVHSPRFTWLKLFLARIAVWWIGGGLLWIGGGTTLRLMLGQGWPTLSQIAWFFLTGGSAFVLVELVVHIVLLSRGYPSLYRQRDGRYG